MIIYNRGRVSHKSIMKNRFGILSKHNDYCLDKPLVGIQKRSNAESVHVRELPGEPETF